VRPGQVNAIRAADTRLETEIALAQAGAGSPRRLDRLIGWLDSVIPNVAPTRALELECVLQNALVIRYQRDGVPEEAAEEAPFTVRNARANERRRHI
jgi:hypothetical protein